MWSIKKLFKRDKAAQVEHETYEELIDQEKYNEISQFVEKVKEDAMVHNGGMYSKVMGSRYKPEVLYNKLLSVCSNHLDKMEKECGVHNCCARGCAKCCEQPIYLSGPEKYFVLNKVYELPGPVRDKVYLRAIEVARVAAMNGIPRDITLDTDLKELVKRYIKLGLKCPCLGDNNECLIYNLRPLVCMNYRNYSEASDCEGKISPYSVSFEAYGKLSLNVMAFLAGALKMNFDDQTLMPMLLAEQVQKIRLK